ncbi:MAG: hypothetical protein J6036_05860 [Clostridia bacterium]|nr:hypothetical protein [Clostridia bacterium]
MEEKIYTIPVTEAFKKKCGCPLCTLTRDLEKTELDLIMGASMMEPDIRIQTNKLGFCKNHYKKMSEMGNKLSLALMLESHLNEIKDDVSICKKSLFGKDNSQKFNEKTDELSESCYVCEKVNEKFSKMVRTAVYLWETQRDFVNLLKEQPYFCLVHASMLLKCAKARLDKKKYLLFAEDLDGVVSPYLASLGEDVSWFCKKFDYRFDAEPWGNAKDSVERAIKFLKGDF